MILKNDRISGRQLNRLMITSGMGTLMMILPDAVGGYEAGLVTLFTSFLITLLHLKLVFWLIEKHPGGRNEGIGSRLAAGLELLKCLALAAALLLAAASTIKNILLSEKSFALIAAFWIAAAIYLACAGTEARARFGEAVWLVAAIPLAGLLLLCFAHLGAHGSSAEGALITWNTITNDAGQIIIRAILYSAVFAPVELLYWCRSSIIQEDSALDQKTKRQITGAVCFVFVFAALFCAAATGILGIRGIQETEHSALALAAGLDVMGAVIFQKQGIAILFFLTGMVAATGILLGQAGNLVGICLAKRRSNTGRAEKIIFLCLGLLAWCAATGFYERLTAQTSGSADSVVIGTTAQIEDRAYCTVIGIDPANSSAVSSANSVSSENSSVYLFTLETVQSSGMKASLTTYETESLASAAVLYNADSSLELDVSHLQILLLGEGMRKNAAYQEILIEFGNAAEYYFGGTLLAFTEGTAENYLEDYTINYDRAETPIGIHLQKRYKQGLKSDRTSLGSVYYRWLNRPEEDPAAWIPTLSP